MSNKRKYYINFSKVVHGALIVYADSIEEAAERFEAEDYDEEFENKSEYNLDLEYISEDV